MDCFIVNNNIFAIYRKYYTICETLVVYLSGFNGTIIKL